MSARSNAGRIGVWGASGSGKSSYVKKAIKGRKRMVVFDPLGEYSALCNVTCQTVEQVRLAMRKNWAGFSIAFLPRSGGEIRDLSRLCKFMMVAQMPYKESGRGQGMTLVVEEMNLSFPVAGVPSRDMGFAEICSRGRHYGIEVYGLSQRIAEVGTRFRGNCTESVVLRQKEPRDVIAAASVLGCHKSEVMGLKNLDYIHEQNGTRKKGRIKF